MKTLIMLSLALASSSTFASDDLNSPHALLAYLNVQRGAENEFLQAAKKVIVLSRKEPGNLTYILQRSVEEPQQFVFYEVFKSDRALESHRQSPHVIEFLDRVKPILTPGGFTLVKYTNVQ